MSTALNKKKCMHGHGITLFLINVETEVPEFEQQ